MKSFFSGKKLNFFGRHKNLKQRSSSRCFITTTTTTHSHNSGVQHKNAQTSAFSTFFCSLSFISSRTHTDNNNRRSALSGSHLGFDIQHTGHFRKFFAAYGFVVSREEIFFLMSCFTTIPRGEKEKRFRLFFYFFFFIHLFYSYTRSSLLMCISFQLFFSFTYFLQ